jgi:hypothetical protein
MFAWRAMTDETGTTASHSSALPPGSKINRYEIVSVLTIDGAVIAYRSRDRQLDRHVVIREYFPEALATRQDGIVTPRSPTVASDFDEGLRRFADRGQALAKLSNVPATERLLAFLEVDGTAYIVAEFVDGETLETRARRRPLSENDVHSLLWPLLDGLQRIHAAGYIHGGISGAHIMLTADGHPSLVGFRGELSKARAATEASFDEGVRADIFDLSAALYCAIAGGSPSTAAKSLTKMRPPGLSVKLLAGIDAGLGFDEANRPRSVSDLLVALGGRPAYRPEFVWPLVDMTSATTRPRPRRPLLAAAAAFLALVLLIIGYFFAERARQMSANEPILSRGAYDGHYIGVLRYGTSALIRVDLAISNEAGKGDANFSLCGVGPVELTVTDVGYVTGSYFGYRPDCIRQMYEISGQINEATLDLVVHCKTCSDVATGTVYRLAAVPTEFDGKWAVTHTCQAFELAKPYVNHYGMIVTGGYAVAQWRTPGQPDSWTLEGQIRSDGALTLLGTGRMGQPIFNANGEAAGTPLKLTMTGQLKGDSGELEVAGPRHCAVTLVKDGR